MSSSCLFFFALLLKHNLTLNWFLGENIESSQFCFSASFKLLCVCVCVYIGNKGQKRQNLIIFEWVFHELRGPALWITWNNSDSISTLILYFLLELLKLSEITWCNSLPILVLICSLFVVLWEVNYGCQSVASRQIVYCKSHTGLLHNTVYITVLSHRFL